MAQLVRILLLTIVLFGALWAIENIIFPVGNDTQLDTNHSMDSYLRAEPRYIVHSRNRLPRDEQQLFLLGASNVRLGLRPKEIAQYIDGGKAIQIHNLAIGGTSIKEMSRVVDLVYEAIPETSLKDVNFVFGIWYGVFINDTHKWGRDLNFIESEMVKYGVYTLNNDGSFKNNYNIFGGISSFKILNPFLLIEAARPYLSISAIFSKLKAISGKGRASGVVTSSSESEILKYRAAAADFWRSYMGAPDAWTEDGFINLQRLALKVASKGGKVIIVNMPLPIWHKADSIYNRIYTQRLNTYLDSLLAIDGVSFMEIKSLSDDEFYDSAHPKSEITKLWAEQLGSYFNKIK